MSQPDLPHPDPQTSLGIRRTGFLLGALALPLFAMLVLATGKEAGWDLRNYHWYGAYALLHGRLGFDIAVAHHATYYNALLDVPLFWLGTHFPAWVAGVWLGAEVGVAVALLGAIAYRLIRVADKRLRLALSVALALAGMTGGGAWDEIGNTSGDIPAGLGMLAGLFVIVARFDRAQRNDVITLAVAGVLAGASPGLKLTTLTYVIGLAAALLALPGSPRQRFGRAFVFGLGVLVGIALVGGYWLWTMWRFSGNPLFPYFNDLFASPLVPPGSYRDQTFLPDTLWTALFFPFVFSVNSLRVAEWYFRDVHIAVIYTLAPLVALFALAGRQSAARIVDPVAARFLLVFAAVTYFVWLPLFSIYRYLVPLEMLSPTIIVVAVFLLPLPKRGAAIFAAILLVGAQALAIPGEGHRYGWGGRYVEVAVPKLEDPANTMILMAEKSPDAYVIPAFPPEIPFLRIQGWLIGAGDNSSGMGAGMHTRVAAHKGPIYMLYSPVDRPGVLKALGEYGLSMDDADCQPVKANIQAPLDVAESLLLCPLTRNAP